MLWYFILLVFGDTLNLSAIIKKIAFIFPVNMAMMKHSRLLACLKYQSLVFPCQLLHALGVLFVLLPIYHLSEIITNYNTVDSNKST